LRRVDHAFYLTARIAERRTAMKRGEKRFSFIAERGDSKTVR
jgi:hypothetical protein